MTKFIVVRWYPFQNFKPGKDNDDALKATEVELLYGKSNDRLPIDDEDECDIKYEHHYYSKTTMSNARKIEDVENFYYKQEEVHTHILRPSMECVEEKIPLSPVTVMEHDLGNNKLHSIELMDRPATVPKLALQPVVSRSSSARSEATKVMTPVSVVDEAYDSGSPRIMLRANFDSIRISNRNVEEDLTSSGTNVNKGLSPSHEKDGLNGENQARSRQIVENID